LSRLGRLGVGAVALCVVLSCASHDSADEGASDVSLDSLLALGEQVYLRGEFDSANTLWTSALARSRTLKESAAEARSLTWLGLAAWRRGDYRAARRLGEEALTLKRRWALDADLFKSYNALGLLAWNEGRLSDATELFGLASAAAQAAADVIRMELPTNHAPAAQAFNGIRGLRSAGP